MFSGGRGQRGRNQWYFPQRLTDGTIAVADGNSNPTQSILDVQSTMGHDLVDLRLRRPLGRTRSAHDTRIPTQQPGVPMSHLTLSTSTIMLA